ncbi:MAG: MmcQ/YjbR family DNA-binding protein [Longimicrobiales bacterium]
MPRNHGTAHEQVRAIAMALPGVEEAPCYGTPGFRVRKKLLARFHQDGESLVLKTDRDTREFLIRHRPRTFYLTDHYRNYPYVLVRLAAADPGELREHLEQAWRQAAPKRLVAEYDCLKLP